MHPNTSKVAKKGLNLSSPPEYSHPNALNSACWASKEDWATQSRESEGKSSKNTEFGTVMQAFMRKDRARDTLMNEYTLALASKGKELET